MKYLVVGILALSLAGCGSGGYSLSATEHRNAEMGARQFADQIGAKYVSCSGQDSQRVGYTTCTIFNEKTQVSSELRCTYQDNAVGCKFTPKS